MRNQLIALWHRLTGRSDISINGSTFMHRWRLIHTRRFGVRIHHILRSDNDRELHDHPFDFTSIILWGGYWEHTPGPRIPSRTMLIDDKTYATPLIEQISHMLWTKRKWHGPGSVLKREAEDLHRLELPPGKTTWTLVIRGPMRRRWGFLTAQGWMKADDFARWKGQSRPEVAAGAPPLSHAST